METRPTKLEQWFRTSGCLALPPPPTPSPHPVAHRPSEAHANVPDAGEVGGARKLHLTIFPTTPHKPKGLGHKVCRLGSNPGLGEQILPSTWLHAGHCQAGARHRSSLQREVTEPPLTAHQAGLLQTYTTRSGTEMASTSVFLHLLNLTGHYE